MRILKFEQITDDRFNTNIKELLEKRLITLKEKLNIDGVKLTICEPFQVDFENNTQWRSVCFVEKTTRKITWQDIFRIINSVHPPKYDFIDTIK